MPNSTSHPNIRLLSDPDETDGAAIAFDRVLDCINNTAESIDVHMFVWRNDAIGNAVGQAILSAAERGVMVHIKKDTDAFMYERLEMNRKSFFNVPISASKRLSYKISGLTFPDTFVEDDFDDALSQQIMRHPNVTVQWVNHTHTKYYVFDRQVMITGSINLEDRHRGYRDYMVEIAAAEAIERFARRTDGSETYDPSRSLEFVSNRVGDDRKGGQKHFEIKPAMLELMSQAQHSLYIEMAYIGDPDISRKIVEVARRGVQVTFLFSRAANIGNDINYRSLFRICRQADIEVYLSEKMIHSKLMLIDEETVILGSANTSVFSMQKAVELDVVIKRQPAFVEAVKKTVESRLGEARRVESTKELAAYHRVLASLQQLHQMLH